MELGTYSDLTSFIGEAFPYVLPNLAIFHIFVLGGFFIQMLTAVSINRGRNLFN